MAALSSVVPRPLASDVVDGGKLRLLRVKPVTLQRYNKAVSLFVWWASAQRHLLGNDLLVDLAMVKYLEALFMDAHHPVEGRYAVFGYIFTHPVQHTLAKFRMPLAREALSGWVARCPGRSRDPAPLHLIWLLCSTLVSMNETAAALATAVLLDGYFRPSEVIDLDWRSVARGRLAWAVVVGDSALGEVTKTRQQDDTVVLGIAGRAWVVTCFKAWHAAQGSPEAGRVFPTLSLQKFEALFRAVNKKLNIEKFGITPHVLRHSGPSNDVLEKKITLPGVKKRGRWAVDKSVARYEKSGRLLLKVQQMSPTWEQLSSAASAKLPHIWQHAIQEM